MFTIEVAGLTIRIENRYDAVRQFCLEYLVSDMKKPDIVVKDTEEELKQIMEKAPLLLCSKGQAEEVVIYSKISNALPAFDAFVMHSSVIAVNEEAFAFAAESGVGKSTHTRYWREVLGDKMTIINGDKPIYRFSANGQLTAYGTPWNGKENWGEKTSAPLKALCLLKRGEKNEVYPIKHPSFSELRPYFHVADSGHLDLPKLIRLMDRMLRTIPVYNLYCRNDISAAELAIRTLASGARLIMG